MLGWGRWGSNMITLPKSNILHPVYFITNLFLIIIITTIIMMTIFFVIVFILVEHGCRSFRRLLIIIITITTIVNIIALSTAGLLLYKSWLKTKWGRNSSAIHFGNVLNCISSNLSHLIIFHQQESGKKNIKLWIFIGHADACTPLPQFPWPFEAFDSNFLPFRLRHGHFPWRLPRQKLCKCDDLTWSPLRKWLDFHNVYCSFIKRPNTTIYARGLSSVLISVAKYVCRCVAQGCLVGPSCRLFWDPLEASLLGNFIAQKIGLSQIFERNVSHTMIAWLTHTSSRFHFSASFSSMPKIFNYDFLHSLLL